MDGDVPDHYFTFDGRLASFAASQPVSRQKSKSKGPKTLSWPHRQLDPVNLAGAGFYFDPSPEKPDNVVCFLCQKQMADWDEDDRPLEEHLRLSPRCGWAIVAAIEAGIGNYNTDDPSHPDMMEARKATFAGRWPHDGKRGWKCKTKQLVDAGWKYTPTLDSDDMATCTYCQLALDGWEPDDKPMNEHYKRSPDCPFFTLIEQYQQGPSKKTARGKATRSSRASRLSVQSVATTDTISILDQTLDPEDSVMTTTSVMTAGGTKRTRAKKVTTAKGKKTRGKKDEPVEVLEDAPEEPPAPPPKPTRGRKRASDAIDDSVLTNAEAPAPKKRAGRVRRSNTVDTSVLEPQQDQDQEMADSFPAPPAKTTRKKAARGSKSRTTRTRQASVASTASTDPLHGDDEMQLDQDQVPNDDELDRQLEADLDRPLTDDEMIAADSDSDRRKAPTAKTKGKGKKTATKKSAVASQEEPSSNDHAMFNPVPPEVDEADVSAELRQLQQDIEAEETEKLQVPKKGRKAGTRKASKQTKAQKAQEKVVEPTPEPEPQAEPEAEPEAAVTSEDVAPVHEPELVDEQDISMASNATVLRNSWAAAPKKRGRPKKNSTQSHVSIDEQPQEEAPPRMARVDFAESAQRVTSPRSKTKALAEVSLHREELQPPSTPIVSISPAPAAKQPALSPSQSPQSSDAENQPPSSRPSNSNNTVTTTRVALAPVAATPIRASPSKRNVNFLSGLQSEKPWTAVDLDLVFDELDREKVVDGSNLTKGRDLSSPEKNMTVEEWIYHNAGLAEQRLRMECEAMVSKFEREGGRAMQALEAVIVD